MLHLKSQMSNGEIDLLCPVCSSAQPEITAGKERHPDGIGTKVTPFEVAVVRQ
jgi:Zn finger protein HypA/HybF involved in hydrogenase expression